MINNFTVQIDDLSFSCNRNFIQSNFPGLDIENNLQIELKIERGKEFYELTKDIFQGNDYEITNDNFDYIFELEKILKSLDIQTKINSFCYKRECDQNQIDQHPSIQFLVELSTLIHKLSISNSEDITQQIVQKINPIPISKNDDKSTESEKENSDSDRDEYESDNEKEEEIILSLDKISFKQLSKLFYYEIVNTISTGFNSLEQLQEHQQKITIIIQLIKSLDKEKQKRSNDKNVFLNSFINYVIGKYSQLKTQKSSIKNYRQETYYLIHYLLSNNLIDLSQIDQKNSPELFFLEFYQKAQINDYFAVNETIVNYLKNEVEKQKPKVNEKSKKNKDENSLLINFLSKSIKSGLIQNEQYVTIFLNDDIDQFKQTFEKDSLDTYKFPSEIADLSCLSSLNESSLIELAAFFGSQQIFEYLDQLRIQKVIMNRPELPFYVIAGQCPQIIKTFLKDIDDHQKELLIEMLSFCSSHHFTETYEMILNTIDKKTKITHDHICHFMTKCVSRGYFNYVPLFLREGASTNVLLNLFCKANNEIGIEYMLQFTYIDVNTEYKGKTPLEYCIENKNSHSSILLLNNDFINVQKIDDKSSDGEKIIHKACKLGLSKLVSYLIRKHLYDVNVSTQEGVCPIHYACLGGDYETVLAVARSKKVHLKTKVTGGINRRQSPLHFACRSGNVNIVRLLLDSDSHINVNNLDSEGRAPIIFAIMNDYVDIIQLLLEVEDIDINQEYENNNLLQYACIQNKNGAFDILLNEIVFDPNQKCADGRVILVVAIENHNVHMIKAILDKFGNSVNANIDTKNEKTPLIIACEIGNVEIVKLLLDSDNINYNKPAIGDGTTPFLAAAKSGNIELLNLLMSNDDIDIYSKNKDGMSAIHVAFFAEKIEAVNLLIPYFKDNLNDKAKNGETLLQMAAKRNIELAKLLINQPEVDVNFQDEKGMTLFLSSVEEGNLDLIKMLVENDNVDLNEKSKDGKNAFVLAVQSQNLEVVKFFIDLYANDENNKKQSKSKSKKQKKKSKSVDINDSTALFIALKLKNKAILTELINCQYIDINQLSKERTFLCKIVKKMVKKTPSDNFNYDETFDLVLTRNDIDVNKQSPKYDNQTCLHIACKNQNNNNNYRCSNNNNKNNIFKGIKLINKIIQIKGIDINLSSNEGTPLYLLIKYQHDYFNDATYQEYLKKEKEINNNNRGPGFGFHSYNNNNIFNSNKQEEEQQEQEFWCDILNNAEINLNKGGTPQEASNLFREYFNLKKLVEKKENANEMKQNQPMFLHRNRNRNRNRNERPKKLTKAEKEQQEKTKKLNEEKLKKIPKIETPLELVIENKYYEIFEALISSKSLNINLNDNPLKYTPLHLAISNRDLKIINSILERRDIKINIQDEKGETPLLLALLQPDSRLDDVIVSMLKRKDVLKGINIGNNENVTPFLASLRSKNFDIFNEFMQNKDVDVDVKDNKGKTALYLFVENISIQYSNPLRNRSQMNEIKDWRSQMNGINDWRSQMNGIKDWRSQMNGINDWRSQMNEIKDWRSQMNGINDWRSQMNGINDWRSQMNGINDWRSQMNGINDWRSRNDNVPSSVRKPAGLRTGTSRPDNDDNDDDDNNKKKEINYADRIRMLISKCPSLLNIPNDKGETPLFRAIQRIQNYSKDLVDVILFLLDQDDIDLSLPEDLIPDEEEEEKNEEENDKNKKIVPKKERPKYTSLLHMACYKSIPMVVQKLIPLTREFYKKEKDPQLNIFTQKNSHENTILNAACSSGDIDTVRVIIDYILDPENGIEYNNPEVFDINAESMDKITPLQFICRLKSTETTLNVLENVLLMESINVNAKSSATDKTALHYACSNVSEDFVDKIIALKSDEIEPNSYDKEGKTPLVIAALNNREKIVERLLDIKSLDINLAELNSLKTPLFIATENSNFAMVSLLINDQRIEPNNQIMDTKLTPLMKAIENENAAIFYLILNNEKINLNLVDYKGLLALHYACKNNNLEFTKAIVNKIVETDKDNLPYCLNLQAQNNGLTPLHYACLNNNKRIVEFLVSFDSIDPNLYDKQGRTPLVIAAVNGCKQTVKRLLTNKSLDVNLPLIIVSKSEKITPLQISCQSWNDKVFERILKDSRTDPNIPKLPTKKTPLINVIQSLKEIYFDLLINHKKIDLFAVDKSQRTALHYACKKGNIRFVKEIISRIDKKDLGSYLNHQTYKGLTPFHYACTSGNKDVILFFFELSKDPKNKININLQDKKEITPFVAYLNNSIGTIDDDVCEAFLTEQIDRNIKSSIIFDICKKGHFAIIDFILKNCTFDINNNQNENNETLLHILCKNQMAGLVKEMLNSSEVDVNEIDKEQKTALHYACELGMNPEIVQLLIDTNRCNINAKDKKGMTALHYACSLGKINFIEQLVNYEQSHPNSVDVNAQDENGSTPLHLLAIAIPFDVRMNEVLLSSPNCDPNIQDKDGNTPLHFACNNGQNLFVSSLIELSPIEVDINAINGECQTPLFIACLNNNFIMFNTLFSSKLADQIDINLTSPIYIAALKQNLDLFNILFEMPGIDLNSNKNIMLNDDDHFKNHYHFEKMNLMHILSSFNQPELLNKLIESNQFDVNEQTAPDVENKMNGTPLIIALKNNQLENFNLLVDRYQNELNLNLLDSNGMAAIHYCLYLNDERSSSLKKLLEIDETIVNLKTNNKETPLMIAFHGNSTKSTIALLRIPSINVFDQDSSFRTVLHHLASKRSSNECIDSVLNKIKYSTNDIDEIASYINAKDVNGNSAIILGCLNCNTYFVKKLIELFNDLINYNQPNFEGITPFFAALNSRSSAILDHLLLIDEITSSIDLSVPVDSENNYFVHLFARNGSCENFKLLIDKALSHSSNLLIDLANLKNSKDESPLTIAIKQKKIDLLKYILNNLDPNLNIKGEGDTPLLFEAAISYDFNLFKVIVKYGNFNLNEKFKGKTILHYICENSCDDVEKIEYLMTRDDVDFNCTTDRLELTPLHIAAKHKKFSLARTLLSLDGRIDVNKPNAKGVTPKQAGKNRVIRGLFVEYNQRNK